MKRSPLSRKTPLKRTGIKNYKPANKYGAIRSENLNFKELSGRSFDSKLERDVAVMLCIRQRAGEISELQFQHVFKLTDADISWRCDFSYQENGELQACEAKGLEGERWRIIRKLWGFYGHCTLHIYVAGNRGPRLQKTIVPKVQS